MRITPGPWKLSRREGRWVLHRDEAACIADAVQFDQTPGRRAVQVQAIAWAPDDSAESFANLQLALAAPDLLAACEDFLYGRKEARDCESLMQAAIAKARKELP